MATHLHSQRLGWLGVALAAQRNNIASVLARLRGIGIRAGTSLGLHLKFLHLMEQIAIDREKELGLLNEIEEIENRHSEMRQRNLLRRAGDRRMKSGAQPHPNLVNGENKPTRGGLLKILGLIYLFSGPLVKHKNQDLTVD